MSFFKLGTYFTTFSCVSIVEFEQVNDYWISFEKMPINLVTFVNFGDKIDLINKYILSKIWMKIQILIFFKGTSDPEIFY